MRPRDAFVWLSELFAAAAVFVIFARRFHPLVRALLVAFIVVGCSSTQTLGTTPATKCEPLAGVYRWLWTETTGTCGAIDPRLAEAPSFGCVGELRSAPNDARGCDYTGTLTCGAETLALTCSAVDVAEVECRVEVTRSTCRGSYTLRMERAP